MQVFKPQKLSLLHRTIENKQQSHLCVGVLLYFHLDKPRTLLSEIGLWKFVPKALGPETPLDEMVAKTRGEALCVATAYPPGGEPARSCRVRMQIGPIDKTLVAVGDRNWTATGMSAPEPFTEMPVRWSHAFGGEGFAENPVGKGFKPVRDADGQTAHPLPNIEDPARVIHDLRDRPRPAGFMPIDITWSPRMARAGTYDDRWLKESFPGLADDGQWTIYNVAPESQWHTGFFQPDEPYLLENMHPTRPRIEGRLPGAAARVFITQRADATDTFKEIPTRLETVWFFPDAERCVLIYRGSTPVADDEATDVIDILAAVEDAAAPRDEDYYRRIRALRMDKELGGVHALRDADLTPEWPVEHVDDLPDEMAAIKEESLLRKNARKKAERDILRMREKVAAVGLDPDEHAPRMPPPEDPPATMDQLPDFIAKKRAEAERIKAEQAELSKNREATLRQLFADAKLDYGVVEKEFETAPSGPPEYFVDRRLGMMAQVAARARASGVTLPDIEAMLANPQFRQGLIEIYLRRLVHYRQNAHLQAPAARRGDEESAQWRAFLEARVREGGSLVGFNLTGVSLRGLNLSGQNLSQVLLERADLTGCDLSNCNLSNAVLSRADLSGADLTRANLESANLGEAVLYQANLEGANLARAIAPKADFREARMVGVSLDGAEIAEARFSGADLRGARMDKLTVNKTDLSRMNLSDARLDGVNFIEVNLDGADLTDAILTGATLITSTAREANFTGANMGNFRAQLGCDFTGATFRNTRAQGSNFRDTPLAGSDFSNAALDDSDFTGCDLKRARFVRADLKRTRFVRADLTDADLTGADMMEAVIQKATIQGAVFRHANLYAADMARVLSSPRTVTADANLKKVRVYPLRERKS